MNKDKLYKQVKEQHPNWTDEKIWTQVSVMIGADDAVLSSDPSTPLELLLEIVIKKAEDWLRVNLPKIFAKVAEFFTKLWERLPDIIMRGLNYIWRVIEEIF